MGRLSNWEGGSEEERLEELGPEQLPSPGLPLALQDGARRYLGEAYRSSRTSLMDTRWATVIAGGWTNMGRRLWMSLFAPCVSNVGGCSDTTSKGVEESSEGRDIELSAAWREGNATTRFQRPLFGDGANPCWDGRCGSRGSWTRCSRKATMKMMDPLETAFSSQARQFYKATGKFMAVPYIRRGIL